MEIESPDELSRLLGKVADGNEGAKNALYERVYDQLYVMANRQMKHERPGHSLGATGLVHEVFLRLQGDALRANRAYFFGAAATAMYRILVEHARRSRKIGEKHVPLDFVLNELEANQRFKMLDLHEALEKLKDQGERGRRQHEIVVQRFFGGLPWKEIAANLGIAVTTVEKDWQAARAWLFRRLRQDRIT